MARYKVQVTYRAYAAGCGRARHYALGASCPLARGGERDPLVNACADQAAGHRGLARADGHPATIPSFARSRSPSNGSRSALHQRASARGAGHGRGVCGDAFSDAFAPDGAAGRPSPGCATGRLPR